MMKNTPPHLALPAVGFVGAELAMDEQLETLQTLLESIKRRAEKQLAPDLARACEITKALRVLCQKSMVSGHALATALIQELAARP